jgi:type I restriction enzyme S subunit
MKPYEKYKPSGVEWIGAVPEHWEVKRLKYVGESIIGIVYSPSEISNENEGILVLRSSNIQNATLTFEDCVFVNKVIQEKHLTKVGDILICARNGSAHLVGKSAFIGDKNVNLTFGAFMSVFRSEIGKFIFYFFNSEVFKSQTGLFSTSTINQLTSDTLNNLFAAIPSLPEQTAIARYLDQKTGEIDQLIAQKERLLTLWEEEKTAVINQAVTRGLDAGAKMKDSGVLWLGEVPEHWEVKRLKYWVKSVLGGGTPSTNKTEFWKGTIPWVSPKDMKVPNIVETEDYVTELAIDGSAIQLILPNNILMVVRSGILKHTLPLAINSVPVTLNQDMKAFQPIERIGSQYFYFVLKGFSNSILANCKKIGSTVDSLTMEDLLNFEIPIATTYSEQTAIVRHIEIQTARIQTQMDQTRKLIELLKAYRATLISEVVTGKIKITQ